MATCVQPAAVSQSAKRSSSRVVVPNVRTSWRRWGPTVDGGRNTIRASIEVLSSSSAIETVYPVP